MADAHVDVLGEELELAFGRVELALAVELHLIEHGFLEDGLEELARHSGPDLALVLGNRRRNCSLLLLGDERGLCRSRRLVLARLETNDGQLRFGRLLGGGGGRGSRVEVKLADELLVVLETGAEFDVVLLVVALDSNGAGSLERAGGNCCRAETARANGAGGIGGDGRGLGDAGRNLGRMRSVGEVSVVVTKPESKRPPS